VNQKTTGRRVNGGSFEISIFALINILLRKRLFLLLFPAAATLIAVVIVLFLPSQYTAVPTFLPEETTGAQQLVSAVRVGVGASSGRVRGQVRARLS
jgi:uncharacterized protein involved in exopolysaccharide biosynthesis